MNYDFDKVIDRTNTNSLKYDFAVERGRPADVLPLWVADMDFPAPQPVQPVMPNPVYSNVFDAGLDTPVAAPKAAPVEEEDDSDYFNDLLSILNKRS